MKIDFEINSIKTYDDSVFADVSMTATEDNDIILLKLREGSVHSSNPNAGILDLQKLAAQDFIKRLEGVLEELKAKFSS